jgi:hypothetical protein
MKGAGWSPGNDDQQIWYTTTADGHTFADQAIVPGALTVSKPALQALPGTGEIYMAWNDSQGRIWRATFNGQEWGPSQEPVSACRPAPASRR